MAASESDPMHRNNPFMPISLPLIAATAPDHDYEIIDLLAEKRIGFDDDIDIVGISVRFTSEKRAYDIADNFRKRGVMVVLGGPMISAVPFKALNHADAVVIGEADQLWPKILEDVNKKKLKEMYVCSPDQFDSKGHSLSQIYTYLDMKNASIPLRKLMKRKYPFDTVFASRGCPIKCDFCAVSSIFGTKFRLRPINDVVAEINTLKVHYYLIDDTVFGKASTYDYYINLYTELGKLKKKRFWTGQANLDAAADEKGREVIKRARDSGLTYAAVGMESINPVVLNKSGAIRKMGVKSSENLIDKMKDNIRFIQEQGIVISGWFPIGYEEDTIETYYKTYEFCEEMNILPAIFPINAMPDTLLYDRIVEEGKLTDSEFMNIANSNLKEPDVRNALRHIQDVGFSFKNNFKRLRFYRKRFSVDKIHQTIFLFILQKKMKAGIDMNI